MVRTIRVIMNRRLFLRAAALLAASAATPRAQKPDRIPVVAILRTTTHVLLATQIDVYRNALRELGYVEGKTIQLEHQLVSLNPNSFDAGAKQLAQSNAAMIFAVGTAAALAMRKATKTIPILFDVADPMGTGLVSSLARLGGNATGVASMAGETGAKRIELLKELLPRAARFGVLANPDNPATVRQLEVKKSAADSLGVKLQTLQIRRVGDLEQVLRAPRTQPIDGLVTIADPILNANQKLLAQHALKNKFPASPRFEASRQRADEVIRRGRGRS